MLLPLEMKKMNTVMKYKQLRDQKISKKMEMKPSSDLSEALIHACNDSMQIPV
jgi:hypothetical protein